VEVWLLHLFSQLVNHPAQFLKDYQALVAVVLTGCLLPIAKRLIQSFLRAQKRFRDVRALRSRVGSEIYTRDDILRATKYFIEPDCLSTLCQLIKP
jgi:hypothetical protein